MAIMLKTVILPYDHFHTTAQDIEQLQAGLNAHHPDVRLRAYEISCVPIWLAEKMTPPPITVTLNNVDRINLFEYVAGPQFFAPNLNKEQLLFALIEAGVPTPHSAVFTPDFRPSEKDFGPYTAIKTTFPGSTQAKGIFVFRTDHFERHRDRLLAAYDSEIKQGFTPVLQRYVNTGPHPNHTRVTTFLGQPIVCFTTTAPDPFDPAQLSDLAGGEATSNFREDRHRQLSMDDEFLDLAQQVTEVFPTTSVLSIDMVRCVETGRIYCLEANLGNLSCLSAPITGGLRRDLGEVEMLKQFGSYDTMARRMIEVLDGIGRN